MSSFLAWYVVVSLLGWLTFPLAYRLFPALTDRGFALARTAGMLIWGYAFWLLASLGIAQNDLGGIFLALALLAGLSGWAFVTHKDEIVSFLKNNFSVVLTTEILFLAAFGFMAFVRSANPELNSTEKPMELAFISAIMRSQTFPPQDPWLSGYAISYYYFGYVMTALLARVTDVPGSMAHNLMTSLIFGLGAIGSYGILYNLLSKNQKPSSDGDAERPSSAVNGLSLFAPLFLLLVSNLGALLEVLHRYGIFWVKDPVTQTYSSKFWTWLDMKELSQPPMEPLQWAPERYLWWWRSSRVLQDYDMRNNPLEVIDEFPFFSFLLGDLHPHVLAIPFTLLAIAVALNLFLGGWRGSINLFGARLNINLEGFFFSALVLGGLAFLNTWDILIGAVLIVLAYVFLRAREDGWSWSRLEDLFLLGIPLGLVSIVMYLPFYFGFSSQAGGILPNLMYPTRGMHLWVMWGTLFVPILTYLLYLWIGERVRANWKVGFSFGLGFILLLWIFSWLLGVIGYYIENDFVTAYLAGQGMDIPTFFRETTLRRFSYIGGLVTMLAILIPSLAFLFSSPNKQTTENESQIIDNRPSAIVQFVMLLLTLGIILVIAPDFAYLRDQFGYRINTVFKFYYQAWVVSSLVAAFGAAVLLQNLRGFWNFSYSVLIGLVLFAGLLYPSLSLMTKTNSFKPSAGYSLDDLDRIKRENPDEAAAIEWLRTAPDGIVLELVGDSYNPSFGRVATYTGLQNVLGWPGHEAQWRGSYAPQGSRRDDILVIYTTSNWETARLLLEKYEVRYVYVGMTERLYSPLSEEKFIVHLTPVFQQGNVTIYEVP